MARKLAPALKHLFFLSIFACCFFLPFNACVDPPLPADGGGPGEARSSASLLHFSRPPEDPRPSAPLSLVSPASAEEDEKKEAEGVLLTLYKTYLVLQVQDQKVLFIRTDQTGLAGEVKTGKKVKVIYLQTSKMKKALSVSLMGGVGETSGEKTANQKSREKQEAQPLSEPGGAQDAKDADKSREAQQVKEVKTGHQAQKGKDVKENKESSDLGIRQVEPDLSNPPYLKPVQQPLRLGFKETEIQVQGHEGKPSRAASSSRSVALTHAEEEKRFFYQGKVVSLSLTDLLVRGSDGKVRKFAFTVKSIVAGHRKKGATAKILYVLPNHVRKITFQ